MIHVELSDNAIRVYDGGSPIRVYFAAPSHGISRTTRQVCARWAAIGGTSERCFNSAWREVSANLDLPSFLPRDPRKVPQASWRDLIQALDSAIADRVNASSSPYYLHG